jgi:VWFA-related protein
MALAYRAAPFLIFTLLLRAQAPEQEVVIRTVAYTPPTIVLHAETNLVETDLTVRDANGHAVAGLQASDFEVLDNGVPQTITAFSELRAEARSATPPAPKFVTFFFDDIHMGMPGPGSRVDMPFVKQAAHDFATKHLKPGDRMSIATTSGATGLDFTGDAQLFAATVDRMTLHAHFIQSWEEYEADSVSTLAALTQEAKRLSAMPGKRVLVFVSAGFIIHISAGVVVHDVQPVVDRFIGNAVHWEVAVPAIDAKGLFSTPARMPAERRPLKEISEGTGGHLFENTNDLSTSMELAAKPESTYLLGFNPGVRDGKFHTLKIRFKSKRPDSLEFRPGYLSRKDDDSTQKPPTPRGPLDEAVFSKETLRDLSATVTVTPGQAKDGAILLSVGITLDGSGLQFDNSHGRHTQQIVFLTTLLDTNGGFVTGQESIMELALTDERLASLRKGFKVVGTLTAPAGNYQLRTVVRESGTGRLAASTAPVELRAE